MIPSPLTTVTYQQSASHSTEAPTTTTEEEQARELTLIEGSYTSRDALFLAAIAQQPNFPVAQNTNVLDTAPRPSTAGVRMSGFPQYAVKNLTALSDEWPSTTSHGTSTDTAQSPKSPMANGSARFKNLATGNLKAYVGGAASVPQSQTSAKEGTDPVKKKKPKTNLLKSNSSFISKVMTHDALLKNLDKMDVKNGTAFMNNSRGILWYDFSAPGKPEQLAKILFSKGHPLCHDVNNVTSSSTHLDLIIGFSTADVVWYEPVSQRYSHINKNGVINASAITGVQWLPGSENLFVATHMDGNIVVYDKERDDAPVAWDEEPQPGPPTIKKGVRQPRLLIRKSVESPNQKTNPVAVYKITKRQLTDLQCSPDGRFVAVTSEDGTLRVVDLLRETLIDLYSSYFGGLTCIAWSPDGKYIITGGQDDFVSLWSFEERTIVARCEGHRSWLTALAFDQWRCDDQNYRFASVGEDCRLLLWDFSLGSTEQPKTPSIRPSVSSGVVRGLEPNQDDSAAIRRDSVEEKGSLESTTDYSIAHAVEPRAEVAILPPVMSKEIDEHPIAWIGFTQHFIALSCHQGHIRTFLRPHEGKGGV